MNGGDGEMCTPKSFLWL